MDVSDVIRFANQMTVATEDASRGTIDPDVFRHGKRGAPVNYVNPDPTKTQYIWLFEKVGISDVLDADSELLGAIEGANVIGTDEPLTPELDPEPRFRWGVVPYDPVTRSKILLGLWFNLPGQPPLYSRTFHRPRQDVWRVDHEGAFDLRFVKIGAQGVPGWANLNLMDDGNQATCVRLISQMCRGRFIHEEEAQVHIADQRPIGDGTSPEEPTGSQPTGSEPTDSEYPEGRLTPAWVDRRVSDFRDESSEGTPSEGTPSSSEGRK